MAKDKTKKRLRKQRKAAKRLRKQLESRSLGPGSPGFQESPPLWDEPGWDDPEGGAGVREPRHPRPTMPAAALQLDEPGPQHLDLTQ